MSTQRRPTLIKKRLSWVDMTGTSASSQKIRLTRRIVQLQQDKTASKILEQGKQLCAEYVNSKLEREGLKRRSSNWSSADVEDFGENWPTISTRVQEVGWMLEECYPKLYTNISKHVNISFTSEEIVHDLFTHVGSEIVASGVNWARIVAVFQFAGALAAECHKDSRSVFVNDLSLWMYEFTAMYLVDWIKRRGGWHDILRAFPRSSLADYIITSRGRWRVIDYLSNWFHYCVTSLRETSRACLRTVSGLIGKSEN